MSKCDKPTFKSYLDEVEVVKAISPTSPPKHAFPEQNADDKKEVHANAYEFFKGEMEPKLLPGERVIAEAENVLKYNPFTEKKQGLLGRLFVTNFKLAFLSSDRSSYSEGDGMVPPRQRNQLVRDSDIPLTSIDTVYQVHSGGKRRQLQSGMAVSGKTKYLHIYCMNFQVHLFSFKFSPKDQDRQIVNALIAFAFPNRPDLLFAFQFAKHLKLAGPFMFSTFNNAEDWQYELEKYSIEDGWTVSKVNANYEICESLPEWFVMPTSIQMSELRSAAPQFIDYRVPTWSFALPNGASLVRMSYMRSETDLSYYEQRLIDAIQNVHPCRRKPLVIDLGKQCASVRDLQQSFEKLKELITADSLKEFWSTDLMWLSALENTRWLENVQACLKAATQSIECMMKKERTVILKESSSRDMCCVVSSLIQLLLDPNCRTTQGLQVLIQKEWIALGHPFQRRCAFVFNESTEESPVFLLFLDCLWQILRQFPTAFAFTDTYLTTLWDSIHLGLFTTCLFDSCYQQKKFSNLVSAQHGSVINEPSVWQWELQYRGEDSSFFNNPLYVIKSRLCKDSNVNGNMIGASNHNILISNISRANYTDSVSADGEFEALVTSSTNSEQRSNTRYYNTNTLQTDKENHGSLFDSHFNKSVLYPDTSSHAIKLWGLCYLRWLVPAEIIGGGSPSHYLQQCLLVEEVIFMQHKLKMLQDRAAEHSRPKSDLIFSYDKSDTSKILQNSVITSSFPYSPMLVRGQTKSKVFTPLISYLENSNIDYDYTANTTNADD